MNEELIIKNEYEKIEEIGKNSYLLKSNEETIQKYPYNFEFYIWCIPTFL